MTAQPEIVGRESAAPESVERYRRSARRHPVQWRRAYRALRKLLDEPENTEYAFEITDALEGGRGDAGLARFLAHREGRRQLSARPSLLAALSDRAHLETLPDDSLGRAYQRHMDRFGLEPATLVELERKSEIWREGDDIARWYHERMVLVHDLMHVLAGYGADHLGEAALLPFSFGQQPGRSSGFLSIGATLRGCSSEGPGWLRYQWRSYRRGRRAGYAAVLPFEELLEQPLAEVRRMVGIDPPEVAHPEGVREACD